MTRGRQDAPIVSREEPDDVAHTSMNVPFTPPHLSKHTPHTPCHLPTDNTLLPPRPPMPIRHSIDVPHPLPRPLVDVPSSNRHYPHGHTGKIPKQFSFLRLALHSLVFDDIS